MKIKTTFLSFLIVITIILSGCAPCRRAVPEKLISSASIDGMPSDIRKFEQDFCPDFNQNPADTNNCNFLALSGGGANGAFGAGVLCGWTQSGNRPGFQVVTGISTGALIAPLAFLGPQYDDELKQIYTSVDEKDIFIVKDVLGVLGMLWNESYADNKPLYRLIEKTITQEKLNAIAREYAKGRRLYVGTTYLDAQRFVVWDMGAIAASKNPNAPQLFRKVLLASTAYPGVFPPVCFDVSADGKKYDEMHVDGGVIAGVFCYFKPLTENENKIKNPCKIYVIKNGVTTSDCKQVERNAFEIIHHSYNTMMKSQARSDLDRIYQLAHQDNAEFNYMCIPGDNVCKSKKLFDQKEMNKLFEIGVKKGISCDWKHDFVIE